ncbi:hypothetical protein BX666DRAFT_1860846 [Dichotomocladium elegans]|nr:hypothetical protein BX666DRAFT_1860846 [Dichotomocladium elegans]
MGWHGSRQRASMSDVKLTGHYDSDDEDMMIPLERRKRRSCMDKVCCGCCTCYPRWARYFCCILGLLVLGLLIAVGVLVALFKKPTVSMTGLDGEPTVSRVGSTINMNFTLNIAVDNPNVESVTFEKIEAKAFYPGHRDVQIGGGELDDVHIRSKGLTEIKFPFGLSMDGSSAAGQAIVFDLFNKCGLTGSAQQKVTVDYDVIPTIRIAGIPISFTISNSANFDCPVSVSVEPNPTKARC